MIRLCYSSQVYIFLGNQTPHNWNIIRVSSKSKTNFRVIITSRKHSINSALRLHRCKRSLARSQTIYLSLLGFRISAFSVDLRDLGSPESWLIIGFSVFVSSLWIYSFEILILPEIIVVNTFIFFIESDVLIDVQYLGFWIWSCYSTLIMFGVVCTYVLEILYVLSTLKTSPIDW